MPDSSVCLVRSPLSEKVYEKKVDSPWSLQSLVPFYRYKVQQSAARCKIHTWQHACAVPDRSGIGQPSVFLFSFSCVHLPHHSALDKFCLSELISTWITGSFEAA